MSTAIALKIAVFDRILLPRSMGAFQLHGLERYQYELATDPRPESTHS